MYAATGARLRAELSALLAQRRIQFALGGPGPRTPATTTPAQRQEFGTVIQRYRASVLTWCEEALNAARPLAFSNLPNTHRPHPFSGAQHEAVAILELQRALATSHDAYRAALPDLALLTTPHRNSTVEHWRNAARAAALAEHDFSGPALAGRISTPQAHALAGDVATVLQALVILDQRYTRTPGWRRLAGRERLGWTALACALDISLGQPDYSIDTHGWRPTVKPYRGAPKPGIIGVLQAEHNLLIRLRSFPNAPSLRLVVDSPRLLSHHLAQLSQVVSDPVAARWTKRSNDYARLQRELRNIAGRTGKGSLAVAEASTAAARARHLPKDTIIEPRLLTAFQNLFDAVDQRVCDIIEHGINSGAYLQRTKVPQLISDASDMTMTLREQYACATVTSLPHLFRIVRTDLRPSPPAVDVQHRAGPSRAALQTALIRRPAREANGPTI